MLRKITIKYKVFTLAFLGGALAVSMAIGAVYSMGAIGTQLRQIAHEDIPLTGAVTQITVHQLEQAVSFERATRYAEIMDHNKDAVKGYEKAKKKFLKLAKKVDQEILDAEHLTAEIIKHETEHGGEQYIIDEFIHVLDVLKKVEKEHTLFDKRVEKVFALFEGGYIEKAEHLAAQVEVQEDKLDHELEALLVELEKFTASAVKKTESLEHDLQNILMGVSLISIIAFLFIAFLIVRGIVPPLLRTKDYADELSKGNLDAEQPVHKAEDEIAEVLSSLSVFKANAIEAEEMRAAQRDQEARAEEAQKKALMEMADAFDAQVGGVIDSLTSSAGNLQETAASMKGTADDAKHASQTVAAASEESSVNVNTVASAMEEMSATAAEIAVQITSASTKSNDTARDAHNANDTVGNLSSLVDNIGEVVISIQDIAEQTNLLALNATIEAARAGDAGKGFAVVADEVKKLANETGQKTEEISSQISAIQAATNESVAAMQRIIGNVSEIDESVAGVSAAVEEQNATTAEITRSVSEASEGAQQVSQTIIGVQQGAETTGESAEAVLHAAGEVANLSSSLKDSVGEFLNQVRNG